MASFKDVQSMAVSKWKLVRSGVLQGSLLGPILFNVFFNYTNSEKDRTFSKIADVIKMCGALNIPE